MNGVNSFLIVSCFFYLKKNIYYDFYSTRCIFIMEMQISFILKCVLIKLKYVKYFRLLICTYVMYVVCYSHTHKHAIMELINMFIFISFTSEKWLTMNFHFCLCYIYKLVNIYRQLKERANWKKNTNCLLMFI